MFAKLLRGLTVAVAAALVSAPVYAQTVPSPAQAQQMLQSNPALLGRLQQMMQSSGLTPDQVRQRLEAQGYPPSLLDQYLPGSGAANDATNALPSDDVFSALRSLGIGDTLAIDSLRTMTGSRRLARAAADSALLDTLRRAIKDDSTRRALQMFIRSRDIQRKELDSGFAVFGLNLFRNDSSRFNANPAGAADPNYRFGPGDQLVLFLTGDVEKSYRLPVTREGFVVIPDVGQVDVAGLTRSQLEDVLYNRLGKVYSGVRRGTGATTRFYIDVSQMGANQIFVNGDVEHPSSYTMSRAGTVMTALYLAGGPTERGSMRNVQVKRNGQTVATLDVYDYATRGDASNDIRLESGDVVFVPPRGPQVRVAGEVLRPATYEVKPTETLADVIKLAGGFSESADERRIQVDRIVPPSQRKTAGSDRRVVDVPAELLSTEPVRAGDVVHVLPIAKRVSSRVMVKGNVWTQGPVAFTPGMQLYDALRRAGGLKPDSYLGQINIRRLEADSTRSMLRTAVFDTTGRPQDNFVLSDGDEITVFSTTDFRPQRYITVNGAVRKPGRIQYTDGMTLRDAVLLADGLTEGASLNDAEIAHLPENRAAGVTAVTQQVSLDSSYVFERGANGHYNGPAGLPATTAKAPEIVLKPYDAILIKQQPEWELQQTVNVQGEVKYPGKYSLTSKNEKLADIIARAGGLTSSGYASGISFYRKKDSTGRIGLDLPRVLEDPSFVDNLQLTDGDSIFIPRFAPVVTVRGAVNSQVGVAYVPGASIDYYIRSAGGATTKGDAGRAYVMQPNGKVQTKERHLLFIHTQPQPQPGSTVYVPNYDAANKTDWLQIAAATTSLLGSLVAITALLK